MSELDSITQKIIGALDAKNAAREQALTLSRKVIQQSALTIRASHRADYDEAARLLAAARGCIPTCTTPAMCRTR